MLINSANSFAKVHGAIFVFNLNTSEEIRTEWFNFRDTLIINFWPIPAWTNGWISLKAG